MKWDVSKLLTTPGAIETTETGELKVAQTGDKMDVVAEVAAINTATPLIKPDELGNAAAGILRSTLTGNTLATLEKGVNLGQSIFVNWAKRQDSSSVTTDFFLTVKATNPAQAKIRSVKLNGGGVFLTETGSRDKSRAKAEGSLTFADEKQKLVFDPPTAVGAQDAVLAQDFSVTSVINLDAFVEEASLKLSITLNAYEDNTGLFDPDLFSSAILKTFDVTAFDHTIAEPQSLYLSICILGLTVLAASQHRRRSTVNAFTGDGQI